MLLTKIYLIQCQISFSFNSTSWNIFSNFSKRKQNYVAGNERTGSDFLDIRVLLTSNSSLGLLVWNFHSNFLPLLFSNIQLKKGVGRAGWVWPNNICLAFRNVTFLWQGKVAYNWHNVCLHLSALCTLFFIRQKCKIILGSS